MISENFSEQYGRSGTYEDVLNSYFQFSKNQCTLIETLLEDLRITLDKDNIKENLAIMLKEGFTF